MSRNYGLGSRDMVSAASIALNLETQKKGVGYSSVGSHLDRFKLFARFVKKLGIGRMERITFDLLVRYGKMQADKVDAEEMQASYAQNLVSSVNSVMTLATNGDWKSVSPTKDCGIPKRSRIRNNPTVSYELVSEAIQNLWIKGLNRQAVVAELALHLGLRSKEASLLNAVSAYNQAFRTGSVSITDGTKGGRLRELKTLSDIQLRILQTASEIQGDARAVMPADKNWKQWREGGLREGREFLKNESIGGYHELRACYAACRYESLTGSSAPCNGGLILDKDLDKEARLQISQELGHNRIDISSAYIGGRK